MKGRLQSPYQFWCVQFCVCLRFKSLSISFSISTKKICELLLNWCVRGGGGMFHRLANDTLLECVLNSFCYCCYSDLNVLRDIIMV